ncbi:MAG: universal stress protein [Acidimicrobiia bacterium]
MFTSIVVGTDGSAPAREAVRYAGEMARLYGATLHVVSAYHLFGDMVLVAPGLEDTVLAGAGVEERVRAEVETMLSELRRDLEADRVTVMTYASAENPAQAILDVAERQAADLIVVGNRGIRNTRVLGSVPSNVVHHASCSVLIVHTWPPKPS